MSGRTSRLRSLLLAAILPWIAASPAACGETSTPAAPAPSGPPMRVVVVRSINADCGLACPEWISAEGTIVPQTVPQFRKILASLGDRRLPILVHSPGGNLGAAVQIARAIRKRHLDVIVARTWFEACGVGSATCPPGASPIPIGDCAVG